MGLAFLLYGAVLGLGVPPAAVSGSPVRIRWLVDLGAESFAVSARTASSGERPLVVSVPGAAYVFSIGSDGRLQKRQRLTADPAAPNGVAATDAGVVVASREGSVSLWRFTAKADPSLLWQRDVGERVTSIGWDGGEAVFVATWRDRLVALSATEGRPLWSVDIGGRAEGPAVVESKDVFVATKAKSLLRLDGLTGRVRWRAALPGVALHSPVFFGDKPRLVICGTWDGQLVALDGQTGRTRWSATLPAKLAGAPLVAPELVAAVTSDGTVHAYDSAGIARWTQSGAADGASAMLLSPSAGDAAPRLLVVSKMLTALDLGTGARLADYPKGAVEDLRRRFADAMLDGVKTYSEGEKRVLLEQEAFEIAGPLFGRARLLGSQVAFGTEDGWAYVFDAPTLRPVARYRAGQPCSGAPLLAGGRVLAPAGEEIFGLDDASGRVLWKKTVGADARLVASEATPGVLVGGRIYALDPRDGIPSWSVRGRFRWAAPPVGNSSSTPWLADDGEGSLKALGAGGGVRGEPVPVAGDVLAILPVAARSWLAAVREGKVFGIAWEELPATSGSAAQSDGRLAKTWELSFEERLAEVRLTGGLLMVRMESGAAAAFDESRREVWRLRLAAEDRIEIVPDAASLVIMGGLDLRVHDWLSGEMKFERKLGARAVGVDIRGRWLLWLDQSGGAYRVDLQDGRLVETGDLGAPLATAQRMPDGFLVTTAAGELGRLELIDRPQPASAGQALVKRGEGQ
jgi:outer membrane protein assembly factor BamB